MMVGGLDTLTARMAGVNLAGGGTGSVGPAATAAPAAGPAAGSGLGSAAGGASGIAAGVGPGVLIMSPQSGGSVAGAGAAAVSGAAALLQGDLPPMAPAYSVPAAKQILEACYA